MGRNKTKKKKYVDKATDTIEMERFDETETDEGKH